MAAEKKRFSLTTREIGEITGFSSATVSHWVRKKGWTVKVAPRRARTGHLKSVDFRRRLVARLSKKKVVVGGRQYVEFPSAQSIATELAKNYAITASKETVRRDLLQQGLRPIVRPRVTTVAAVDHQKRLAFSRQYVDFVPVRFVFCDEKLFSTNDFTCRQQWVQDGDVPLARERKRWPAARVMVWGCIGVNFRVLVIFPETRKHTDKESGDVTERAYRLTGDEYRRRCLPKITEHCRKNRLIFVQDGAGCHSAAKTTSYLASKHVRTVAWPPRSPDLNPIETLWAVMQPRVAQK